MSDSQRIPKVNDATGTAIRLKESEILYMKLIEAKNLERVEKLKKIRRNNILTGSALGLSVLGIYFYSMYAVKQEHFLDDFKEPEKIHK